MIRDMLVLMLLAAAVAGCLFMLAAAMLALSEIGRRPRSRGDAPSVTVLKPLHGDEAGLYDNLASFCTQDYPGAVQIVFGVADVDDPAIATVDRLRAAYPALGIELVVDARVAGSNPKVANLINMSERIAHDIVVIADSDICVKPDYLSRIISELDERGGAATVPYYGLSTGNMWSELSRLMIDSHFLPGVLVSARAGLSQPCLGSTIALRHSSLIAIGGFQAVADSLADDYELGALLARQGDPVALLPFAVGHVCADSSFLELWRHELRWTLTIRTIDPLGYCGWTVTHAFPLSLLAFALGGGWLAIGLAAVSLACRTVLIFAIERAYRLPSHPYWLIPLRDLLSFATFISGLFARNVSWRGSRFKLESEGTIIPDRRTPSP